MLTYRHIKRPGMVVFLFFFLVGWTSLLGCTHTVGKPFDAELSKSIRSGVTTKADVVQMLGTPYRKDSLPDRELWQYVYGESSTHANPQAFIPGVGPFLPKSYETSTASQTLTITFQNDVVASCQYVTTTRERDYRVAAVGAGGSTVTTKCGDEDKQQPGGGAQAIAYEEALSQIQKGKSTKADVKQLIGDPGNVFFTGDGDEMWYYMSLKSVGLAGSEMHTLTVHFGSDGVVKAVGKGKTTSGSGMESRFPSQR